MGWLVLVIALLPLAAAADTLVAARVLPAGTVITAADLRVAPGPEGPAPDPAQVIGLAPRAAIYEGRPILAAALVEPALVERNQLVTLAYDTAALSITTTGRALGAGKAGDVIAVMNLNSRTTVQALVKPDGTVSVIKN